MDEIIVHLSSKTLAFQHMFLGTTNFAHFDAPLRQNANNIYTRGKIELCLPGTSTGLACSTSTGQACTTNYPKPQKQLSGKLITELRDALL